MHEDLIEGRVRRGVSLDDSLLRGPASRDELGVALEDAAGFPAAVARFEGGEDAGPEARHVGLDVFGVGHLVGEEPVDAGDVADVCADCVGEGCGLEDGVEEAGVWGGVGLLGSVLDVADFLFEGDAVD